MTFGRAARDRLWQLGFEVAQRADAAQGYPPSGILDPLVKRA
jgi:hypothetical protein